MASISVLNNNITSLALISGLRVSLRLDASRADIFIGPGIY